MNKPLHNLSIGKTPLKELSVLYPPIKHSTLRVYCHWQCLTPPGNFRIISGPLPLALSYTNRAKFDLFLRAHCRKNKLSLFSLYFKVSSAASGVSNCFPIKISAVALLYLFAHTTTKEIFWGFLVEKPFPLCLHAF